MLAKLSVIIVTIGVVGCVLLTNRQLRLQAVHDLAMMQRRVAEHDRTLWHLRVEIATHVVPRNVDKLARGLGPMEPIPVGPRAGAPKLQVAAVEPARPARAPRQDGARR